MKVDDIVDSFVEHVNLDGHGIEAYSEINWIDNILNRLPTNFPPTFMSLISRYIFDDFELGKLWFFANRGDQYWDDLSQAIFRDKIIFRITSSKGFLHFARPADGSYDPICFDIRKGKKHEYPVVRLDHESILISEKIEIVENISTSLLEYMKNEIKS